MKYKKYFTVMQAALGIAPLNKREFLPPPRRLWKTAEDQYTTDLLFGSCSRDSFYWNREPRYLYLYDSRRVSVPNFSQHHRQDAAASLSLTVSAVDPFFLFGMPGRDCRPKLPESVRSSSPLLSCAELRLQLTQSSSDRAVGA
ncbi:hypothetical protein COCON_G00153500 [Conger conger]|uniref:Uncharacterized protein n=1 Tax=Conger conger TaxID=82655 RepID=A0A9Q1D8Q9_CONCO|nr:hypothetical protein COCON_G00153500 [Conger conger]